MKMPDSRILSCFGTNDKHLVKNQPLNSVEITIKVKSL
jgi:hypothetical protein